MQYAISSTYTASGQRCVTFPEGKTWDDVQNWDVKYDVFRATFKDGTRFDEVMDTDILEGLDYRRPASVDIFPADSGPRLDNVSYC
jgi:hypothetical protein